MKEESLIYNFLQKYSWILLTLVSAIILMLSLIWFLRNKGLEPLLALVTSTVTLLSLLFSKGSKSLLLVFGGILGISFVTVLLYLIPQINPKQTPEELKLSNEIDELAKVNKDLQNEISQLKNDPLTIEKEARKLGIEIPTKAIDTLTINKIRVDLISCRKLENNIQIAILLQNLEENEINLSIEPIILNDNGEKSNQRQIYSTTLKNGIQQYLRISFDGKFTDVIPAIQFKLKNQKSQNEDVITFRNVRVGSYEKILVPVS